MKKAHLLNMLLCATLLVCQLRVAYAQSEIDFSATTYVQHLENGSLANFIIGTGPAINGLPGAINFTWSWCVATTPDPAIPTLPQCAGGVSVAAEGVAVPIGYGLTATFTDGTGSRRIVIGGTPDIGLATHIEFTTRFRLEGNGDTYEREYHFVIRKPWDIVFVLDRSGSMECGAGDDSVTGWPCSRAAPNRRWDKLKDAIDNFCSRLPENRVVAGDRMGVVYFAGSELNADPSADPGSCACALTNLNTVSDFRSRIRNNMSTSPRENDPIVTGKPPLGRSGTSIGKGLNEAFTGRFSALTTSRRQIVVLFTDGEPNTPPDVVFAGGTKTISGGGIAALTFSSPPYNELEIYVIGVGIGPGYNAAIEQIATSSSNVFQTITGAEATFLDEVAGTAFNEIFNRFTPHYVKFEDQPTQLFHSIDYECNKNVSELMFQTQFDFPLARNYSYKIEKDGQDVTRFFTQADTSDYYASFAYNFQNIAGLSSEGKWTFSCVYTCPPNGTREGTQIEEQAQNTRLLAIADDYSLNFDTSVDPKTHRVGESAELSVHLDYAGAAIENADVSAYILKPGGDLGDVLARATAQGYTFDSQSEIEGCAAQKYAYLQANDPEVLADVKEIAKNVVQLQHAGNGHYRGSYNGLNVSGTYKVVFVVDANHPTAGAINRMKPHTMNVQPGAQIILEEKSQTTDAGATQLRFRPAYVYGGETRYLGSGYTHGLAVNGEGVELRSVEEDCNGNYVLELGHSGDSDIEITLYDRPIYEGNISGFSTSDGNTRPDNPKPWNGSLHLGYTIPMNALSTVNASKGSVFVEFDFGYRLQKRITTELLLGYYTFRTDYYILGATLCARYDTGLLGSSDNRSRLDVGAGAGMYLPKEESAVPGINVRAAYRNRINSLTDISVEAAYFRLFNDLNYSFATIGLGFYYRF